MDLRTTTSAMAAEAAAHEARSAMDGAQGLADHDHDHEHEHPVAAEPTDDEETPAEPEGVQPFGAGEVTGEGQPEAEAADAGADNQQPEEEPDEEPAPKVVQRDPRELKMLAEQREREMEREAERERVDIPPAYRADIAPLSGNGSLSAWLTHALAAVGPQGVSRIIAAHRAWGHLPPNLSRALAYVQEMLDETDEADPAWLRVMQELDELASL
jgi:hypothetical protein